MGVTTVVLRVESIFVVVCGIVSSIGIATLRIPTCLRFATAANVTTTDAEIQHLLANTTRPVKGLADAKNQYWFRAVQNMHSGR